MAYVSATGAKSALLKGVGRGLLGEELMGDGCSGHGVDRKQHGATDRRFGRDDAEDGHVATGSDGHGRGT